MTPVQIVMCTPFGRIQRAIAMTFAEHIGEWISTEVLVNVAYRNQIDGGPDDAKRSVKAHVNLIRRRLAPLGFRVEGRPYSGRRLIRRTT